MDKRCITPDGKLRWHSTLAFDRTVRLGRFKARATMRANDGAMGRLGGGWSWKFGILAARTEMVFELFVMSVRISWSKP
jgi:hypothetical protein